MTLMRRTPTISHMGTRLRPRRRRAGRSAMVWVMSAVLGQIAAVGLEDEDRDDQTEHSQQQGDGASEPVFAVAERGLEHVEGERGGRVSRAATCQRQDRVED